jgi:hypothetical protein
MVFYCLLVSLGLFHLLVIPKKKGGGRETFSHLLSSALMFHTAFRIRKKLISLCFVEYNLFCGRII